MSTIGERVRWARKRRLLSQEDLSAASTLPVVTISRIENDHPSEPRPSTIKKLAQALDVSPAWLMFGEEYDKGKEAA
ncbi:hypothetical protein BH23CHL1_BH23CHL1_19120 [soil metagenome]